LGKIQIQAIRNRAYPRNMTLTGGTKQYFVFIVKEMTANKKQIEVSICGKPPPVLFLFYSKFVFFIAVLNGEMYTKSFSI
jgi:hypothetical protein